MNKISVVINTYNAERHLARVLETVKNFDEIVICDMESTDSTLQIAREYGCKIVTFPKGNHVCAEPARTFAIQSASHQWVLVVDADELVTNSLREYLYGRIAEPDCPSGLYIPRKNYFMGKFLRCFYPDSQLRFFIKEGTIWPPYVHTFPKVNGRIEKISARRRELAFIHLDAESIYGRLERINRYTDNEVEKKWSRNYGVVALIWRPLYRFIKRYIINGGFLDGKEGFIYSFLDATYQVAMVGKILEKKNRLKEETSN